MECLLLVTFPGPKQGPRAMLLECRCLEDAFLAGGGTVDLPKLVSSSAVEVNIDVQYTPATMSWPQDTASVKRVETRLKALNRETR